MKTKKTGSTQSKSKQASAKQTPDQRKWRRACRLVGTKSGQPWTVGQFRAMTRLLLGRYDALAAPSSPSDPAQRAGLIR